MQTSRTIRIRESGFAYSQTRADKTAEAISLIVDVVKGLRDTPVPEAELQRTKDSLINSFVFGFREQFANRLSADDS